MISVWKLLLEATDLEGELEDLEDVAVIDIPPLRVVSPCPCELEDVVHIGMNHAGLLHNIGVVGVHMILVLLLVLVQDGIEEGVSIELDIVGVLGVAIHCIVERHTSDIHMGALKDRDEIG